MPLHASLTLFGEDEFAREIIGVGARAVQARPAFDAVGWELVRIQREQFDTEGARSGHPWEPLAESTIAAKGNDVILVDHGILRDSFIPGDPYNVFEVDDDSLVFGSLVPWGVYHHSRAPREHLPRRPVMDLTEMDRQHIVRILWGYIRTGRVPF